MKIAAWVLVGAALVAGLVGYRWWNSPERQIRRVLDGIATRLSHDRPLEGLAAAGALAGLQADFSPDAIIEAGPSVPQLSGRDAVIAAAARVVSATPALQLEIADARIAVDGGGDHARVTCSVTARLRDHGGRETVDVREMTIDMRLVDGRWLVRRAAVVNPIEPVT